MTKHTVSIIDAGLSMTNNNNKRSQWKMVLRVTQFTISAVLLLSCVCVCVLSTVNTRVGDEAQKAPASQLHMRTEQLSTQPAFNSNLKNH